MSEKHTKKLRRELNQFIGKISRKNTKQPEPVKLYGGGWTGYWDSKIAPFQVVTVQIVAVPGTPLHWQNAFVGETRQAVKVSFEGKVFLIDNETGQGLYKVTTGKGMASVGHSAITQDCPELCIVEKENWQHPDGEKHKADGERIHEWRTKNCPTEYAKMVLESYVNTETE